jgi:hypothetical protein
VRHDLDRINAELARRIDDVVGRLFSNAVKDGGVWALGDLNDKPGRSLKIWRRGVKQGEWWDFSEGRGGHPLGLVIEAALGGKGDAGEGIRWAAKFCGVDGEETPEERAKREANAARQREQREREEADAAARKRRAAQGLFLHGGPIAGTMAEDYLRGRGVDLRRLGRQPGSLRFHPTVRCPDSGRDRPALLAGASDAQGFLTVHRTYLFRLNDGRVVKADAAAVPAVWRMVDAKKLYGPMNGGIVSIWRGDSGKPLHAMPAGEWIVLTEGIEDAVSVAIAAPEMRVGCVVALPFLGRAFLPKQCGGVLWHRHRGDGPKAVGDLERQYQALRARGIDVKEIWAPDNEKDFNAWLMKQNRDG